MQQVKLEALRRWEHEHYRGGLVPSLYLYLRGGWAVVANIERQID